MPKVIVVSDDVKLWFDKILLEFKRYIPKEKLTQSKLLELFCIHGTQKVMVELQNRKEKRKDIEKKKAKDIESQMKKNIFNHEPKKINDEDDNNLSDDDDANSILDTSFS